jgi:hypothetical protein
MDRLFLSLRFLSVMVMPAEMVTNLVTSKKKPLRLQCPTFCR